MWHLENIWWWRSLYCKGKVLVLLPMVHSQAFFSFKLLKFAKRKSVSCPSRALGKVIVLSKNLKLLQQIAMLWSRCLNLFEAQNGIRLI